MKKLTAALVVGSVLALTAGCTSASPTTESKSHQTLTVWYNAADAAPYLDVYKRWEKASGNKVKLVSIPADTFQDQVQTRWAAGDRPDILEYHATSLFLALNPAQNLVPLTNEAYVKKSGDLYKSVGSSGGQVYAAITGGLSQFGAFYNKNVLAQNGLEAPQSYADLEHICTVLKQKDPGVIPIWESGGSAWPTQILGGLMYTAQYNIGDKYANRILSKKTQLTDPNGPFVKGMTAYDDLSKAGCFGPQATTQKFEDSIPAILSGKTAIVPLVDGFVDQLESAAGGADKVNSTIGWAVPSATGPAVSYAPGVAGTYYVVKTGNDAKQNAALDFIRYATGKGYQQTVDAAQIVPTIEGFKAPSSFTGLRAEFQKTLKGKTALAFNTNLLGMNANFDKTMTGILSGQTTPAQAAAASQQQLEQGAQAAGLKGW